MNNVEGLFPSKLVVEKVAYQVFDEMPKLFSVGPFEELNGNNDYVPISNCVPQVFDPGIDVIGNVSTNGLRFEGIKDLYVLLSRDDYKCFSGCSEKPNQNHDLDYSLGTENEIDVMRKIHYKPTPLYVEQAEGNYVDECLVFPFVCMMHPGCHTTESMFDELSRLKLTHITPTDRSFRFDSNIIQEWETIRRGCQIDWNFGVWFDGGKIVKSGIAPPLIGTFEGNPFFNSSTSRI